MIFKRKSNKLPRFAARALAHYFSITEDTTSAWVKAHNAELTITLPFCIMSQHSALTNYLNDALQHEGLVASQIILKTKIKSAKTAVAPVNNVKNIVAVASGKGGVGKSTTAVNLAYALMQEGAKVGILDADIYGPSIPIMLGNPETRPQSQDEKHMEPPQAWGLVANSIGYLVPAEDAAVWRGPMASKALKQILNETLWPVLDYLIVDMPPGTGDIQLTMAQQVPVTGAVIVTTPQDMALADAQKGITMFNKVNVPVLGLIENMSYYQCTQCGHIDPVFAQYGGEALAEKYHLPLLGQLPLNTRLREHSDAGTPLVVTEPDDAMSQTYREIARALSINLALSIPVAEKDQHIKGDPIGFKSV